MLNCKELLQELKIPTVVVTAGGGNIFPDLTSTGGASSFFMEGHIPYAKSALESLIGPVNKCVSYMTAKRMADYAFGRSVTLAPGQEDGLGVGSTSVLYSGPNEREGREHKVIVGVRRAFEKCRVFETNINFPPKDLLEASDMMGILRSNEFIRVYQEQAVTIFTHLCITSTLARLELVPYMNDCDSQAKETVAGFLERYSNTKELA